jgi:hypothetical protein
LHEETTAAAGCFVTDRAGHKEQEYKMKSIRKEHCVGHTSAVGRNTRGE